MKTRDIRLIDTAGMRKKRNVIEKLEKLSVADARRAVDFAEVVVLLLDATQGLEHQDLKIASMALEEGRALMIAINKWDIAEDASALFNGIRGALDDGLAQVRGLPALAVSAKTGKGLDPMLNAAFDTARQLVQARADRCAQPLVRRCDGGQSAARTGWPPDQAALHHAGRHPSAALRDLRHTAGGPAHQLRTVSGQWYSRRSSASMPCPFALILKSPKNPYNANHGRRR